MALTDTEHAIFVRQEYRYAEDSEPLVKARNPQAREESLNTNLGQTDAEALATNYLSANDDPRYFDIELEGLLDFGSFAGGPVSYLLDFPSFQTDMRPMTVVSVSLDFNSGKSTIGVRG